MDAQLVDFFKDKKATMFSVLSASLSLAETVQSDLTLSLTQKSELVVASLKKYLEGTPELAAMVESVVPEMLKLVNSVGNVQAIQQNVRASCISCMTKSSANAPVSASLNTSDVVTTLTATVATVTSPGSCVSVRSWFQALFSKSVATAEKVEAEIAAVKAIKSPAEQLKEMKEMVEKFEALVKSTAMPDALVKAD